MEARVTMKKVVALILNEQEALWLKAVMQNPLHEDESNQDREVRHAIFESLDDAGL